MAEAADGGTHLSGSVLIIGTGLLGTSIGLGLRARGHDVVLSDLSPSTEAVARDIGAGRLLCSVEAGFAPSLVVVAAPPDVTASLAAAALKDWPDAVVVDIASVKSAVLEDLRTYQADLSRYVGTHPMAGREKSGPVAARAELFNGMPWVICATEEATPDAVRQAEALAFDLGAVVSRMSAEDHDASVALTSHLPQVMASLVASRLQETPSQSLALSGNGLRDVTRIAASDPNLWVQILSGNAGRLVPILHGVREDLNRLIRTLENPVADGARLDMAQLIAEGNIGQARIPGKHGGPAQSFVSFTVLVDDTPGQIARLLTEIGEIGVNLEDLRLEHASGRQVGRAEISVLPGRVNDLVSELSARGWKVVQ